jgi:superfamily II DNA or RNA helicase
VSVVLRDYQLDAMRAVARERALGVRRTAVVVPTGGGKTTIFGQMGVDHIAAGGRRVLYLAHRDELITQARDRLRRMAPGQTVGIVAADANQALAQHVVGSVQTLGGDRGRNRRRQIQGVDLMIIDECFPAGTLVGGVPIERLGVGDMVPSWDESTGVEVHAPVVTLMKRRPEALVRAVFDGGRELICTPSHPILTAGGWCPAGALWHGACVLSFTHDATAGSNMHGVHDFRGTDGQGEDRQFSPDRSDVLLRRVSGQLGGARQVGAHGQDESTARVGSDEDQQPDGQAGVQGQDDRDDPTHRAQAEDSRREWLRSGVDATAVAGRGTWLADGGDRGSARQPAAVPLQVGHGECGNEDLRRGGRVVPYLAGAPICRPAPGRAVAGDRVDYVEVLEPGRDGTYGGMCPDSLVYNVEVAGTHTYLVNQGVVVHNCHHAAAKSYTDVIEHYEKDSVARGEPMFSVGFTATLTRADRKALGKVFTSVAYELPIHTLIDEGHLVKPIGVRVEVDDLDLSGVRVTSGDLAREALGEAIESSMAPTAIAKALREHAPDRPTILFAPTVHSAGVIRDALSASGFVAEVVWGAMSTEARRRVLSDYRAGKVQVLCNVGVLTEGTDLPATSCIVIARPTRARGLYQQMVGRGLRIDPDNPGKVDCLVLDLVGASSLGLTSCTDLFAEEREEVRKACVCGVEARAETFGCLHASCHEDCACGGAPCGCVWTPTVMPVEADEPIYADGPLRSTIVDLFTGSSSMWMRTARGVPFLAAGERYVAIVPSDPARRRREGVPEYEVVSVHWQRWDADSARVVVSGVTDFATAMQFGEGDLTREEMKAASREHGFRKRWIKSTETQRAWASSYGISADPDVLASELQVKLAEAGASARIDPCLPDWY